MSPKIYALLLFVSVLLQTMVTTIPFVIPVLVVWYVVQRRESLFVIALFIGLLLDILLVRPLGISSIAFIVLLTMAHLYERKFEIQTREFVFLWSFLGSMGYLLVLDASYVLQQAAINAIFAILMFKGIMYLSKRKLT